LVLIVKPKVKVFSSEKQFFEQFFFWHGWTVWIFLAVFDGENSRDSYGRSGISVTILHFQLSTTHLPPQTANIPDRRLAKM